MAVGQVLGQVVPVVGAGGQVDEAVVAHQVGRPLVGVPVEEPVVPLEAQPQRPAVERARGALLPAGRQVPLAHGEGAVARVAQQLRQPGGRAGDAPVVAGEADGQVGDESHAHPVLVAPGEQAGPGGRAHGGDVEAAVAQLAGGEAVDGGGGDVAAVAAELGEPQVVEHDHQHVRRSPRGPGQRGERGRRLPDGGADHGP